ncbi:MAG: DMT family transporter [Rhodobacter sp.]|nr:DMT family transporter [Paracoccaceae bacterium]MCC0077199.1 DMT family transporter [Rhodobacter sp.]
MDQLIPAALALLAALLFAVNAYLQRRALSDTDPTTGAFLSVAATAGVCWLLAPLFVQPEWFASRGALVFAAVGLFFPAMGQWMQITSVSFVGPSLTASLSSLTPLFAVLIGVVWLNEALNLQASLGLALTIGGLVLATWSPRGIKRGWPIWALAFPVGAALVRGVAQPGIKVGLALLPSPAFALLLGASISAVFLGLLVLGRRARGRGRIGAGWPRFLLVGVMNAAGILSLNAALGRGALTLVSPLVATTPLWALALGVTVFHSETLGWRHLAVALLVVAGGVLILTH